MGRSKKEEKERADERRRVKPANRRLFASCRPVYGQKKDDVDWRYKNSAAIAFSLCLAISFIKPQKRVESNQL
jgi:hypothetical protein